MNKHFEIFAKSKTKLLVIQSLRNIDFLPLTRLDYNLALSHMDHCNRLATVLNFNQVSSPSIPNISVSYLSKTKLSQLYSFA